MGSRKRRGAGRGVVVFGIERGLVALGCSPSTVTRGVVVFGIERGLVALSCSPSTVTRWRRRLQHRARLGGAELLAVHREALCAGAARAEAAQCRGSGQAGGVPSQSTFA